MTRTMEAYMLCIFIIIIFMPSKMFMLGVAANGQNINFLTCTSLQKRIRHPLRAYIHFVTALLLFLWYLGKKKIKLKSHTNSIVLWW